MSHTFFRKMPWEAPYVRDEKGASSGEVVGDSGGKAGEGKSGNVVENVSRQSQAKGRELQKTKPKQTLPKKIPKAKPKIDGPVFSQSPIPMKKIKFRGKNLKPSSFMDEGEKDEEVERGGEKEQRAKMPDYLAKLDAMMELSENVLVEKENPWLGESQVSIKSKLIVE